MIPNVKMGKLPPPFNDSKYQDVTFSVTEECNLRCKYCYMFHKNSFHRMDFETAKKAVDYILSTEPKYEAVVWSFIGGEPTLEMELIDKITDYIIKMMYELDHPWFNNYALFIGTNGVLYKTDAVQNYLKKNKNSAQFAITIDGNKEKHDMHRVTLNGSGSYDVVEESIKLWLEQFPVRTSTKSTFANADLHLLKDSIINLWNLGIEYVAANVVFEDVWQDGDDVIFESQLRELADYVIDNKLWDKYSVRFFDPKVGYHTSIEDRSQNYCGTGKMICVDSRGNYYPCVRFMDFCMDEGVKGYCTGHVDRGIYKERLAPFEALTIDNISPDECKTCAVGSGCSYCTANNYNYTNGESLFTRATFICKMQKAQVRANKYFWKRYSEKTGNISPFQYNRYTTYESRSWKMDGLVYLYILHTTDAPDICDYKHSKNEKMSTETFEDALTFAADNDMFPVILTSDPKTLPDNLKFTAHKLYIPAGIQYNRCSNIQYIVPVYEVGKSDSQIYENDWSAVECVLIIHRENIEGMKNGLSALSRVYKKITVSRVDFDDWSGYDKQNFNQIISSAANECEILITELAKCGAGYNEMTAAPGGKIYAYPAFYHMN